MPKFIKLTLEDRTVFINVDKIEMFNLTKNGLGTQIWLDEKNSFDVKELPIQIIEMLK